MARYLGRHTIGIDQRTGKKVRYADLVEDGEIKGILTTRDNADREHPQKFARRVPTDRMNIRRPSPEPIIGAVSVIANSGGSADLWEGNQTALHLSLVMGEVVVTPAAGLAPVSTIAPVISGTVSQGAQLSTDDGSWDNTPLSYTYQWYADGATIPGATSSTYQVSVTYIGSILHVVVTATNNNGSASRASDFTSAVTEAEFTVNPGAMLLEGQSVFLGSTRELLVTENDIALTGQSVELIRGRPSLAITSGSLAVAGSSVTLTFAVGGPGADVLDLIASSPTVAFSAVRRLRSAYAGSLIRVRRSSDNTQADIGVDGSGRLDQAALLTHCGAGDGFVVTWYDQSGSARNVTHATAAQQPQIVASGVVVTALNTIPVLDFNGSANRLEGSSAMSNLITASAYTYFVAVAADAGSTGGLTSQVPAILCDQTGGFLILQSFSNGAGTEAFRALHWDGAYKTSSKGHASYPRDALITAKFGGGTLGTYIDGGTPGTIAAGNVSTLTGTLQFGVSYNDTTYFNGKIAECVFYNSALSAADINTLGPEFADVTGTTWTTVT